jgi:hypothetical protein
MKWLRRGGAETERAGLSRPRRRTPSEFAMECDVLERSMVRWVTPDRAGAVNPLSWELSSPARNRYVDAG